MATRTDAKGRRKVGVRLGRPRKRPVVYNERDIEALKVLLEFPYARTKFIHQLIPDDFRGGYFNFRDRMGQVLFDQAGVIAYPRGQRLPFGSHLNLPAIWRLTDKGRAILRLNDELDDDVARFYTKDNPGTNRHLPHAMLAWDTMQSIKIGMMQDPNARWRSWREIISNAPGETQELPIPYQFKVTISATFKNGKTSEPYTFRITPDTPIFGAEYALGDGRRAFRNFDIEAETGENRVEPSNLSDPSALKKFLGWNKVGARKRLENGKFGPSLHETQLNIKGLLHLFPCPSRLHIKNMQQCLMRITGGKGSTRFLFQHVPMLEGKIEPMPDLWTSPWSRAGHPPFRLSNPLAHEVCEGCNQDFEEGTVTLSPVKNGKKVEDKWLCVTCKATMV